MLSFDTLLALFSTYSQTMSRYIVIELFGDFEQNIQYSLYLCIER